MPTAVPTATRDMYLNSHPGHSATPPTGVWDGTVSELQVGDYLLGARALVTAVGTAATTRSVTMQRASGLTSTATWVSTSRVLFAR